MRFVKHGGTSLLDIPFQLMQTSGQSSVRACVHAGKQHVVPTGLIAQDALERRHASSLSRHVTGVRQDVENVEGDAPSFRIAQREKLGDVHLHIGG